MARYLIKSWISIVMVSESFEQLMYYLRAFFICYFTWMSLQPNPFIDQQTWMNPLFTCLPSSLAKMVDSAPVVSSAWQLIYFHVKLTILAFKNSITPFFIQRSARSSYVSRRLSTETYLNVMFTGRERDAERSSNKCWTLSRRRRQWLCFCFFLSFCDYFTVANATFSTLLFFFFCSE